MKITADEFNERHPVGTPVTYHHVIPEVDGILPLITHTRTPAWELGDGTPVVSVQGRSGGMALSHVELRVAPELAGDQPTPAMSERRALMQRIDAMIAERHEDECIRCPHCQHVQDWDSGDIGDWGLITYHGEDGAVVVECGSCEDHFNVRENVARTFDTAKVGEDFE